MWEAERSFAFLPFHRPALVIEIMRLRRSRSMKWIAFKMLTGDLTKYFSMVFGVAFASLLMAQQMAIFCGIMMLTTAQVRDVEGGDIWVMDPDVLSIDDFKPLRDTDLYRIRGVPGVKWAVPLYKGIVQVRLTIGADRVSRGRDRPDGVSWPHGRRRRRPRSGVALDDHVGGQLQGGPLAVGQPRQRQLGVGDQVAGA